MGQKFGIRLAGCSWLRVCYEVIVRMSARFEGGGGAALTAVQESHSHGCGHKALVPVT